MKSYSKSEINDILSKIEEVKNDISNLKKQTDYKSGVMCPECGSFNNRITNIRESGNGFKVRRRECLACYSRWNTTEILTDLGMAKRKLEKTKREWTKRKK